MVEESTQPGLEGLAGSPPPVPCSSRPELPRGAATAGVGLWSYLRHLLVWERTDQISPRVEHWIL